MSAFARARELVPTVEAEWARILAWADAHAPGFAQNLRAATPASHAAIEELEATIGRPLPADLIAELLLHGNDDGAYFYEYAGRGAAQMQRAWRSKVALDDKNTFDAFEPREIRADERRVRHVWWHRGWIELATDGGGNALCVDLAPGPAGTVGQIIQWEIHGGPTRPLARSYLELLRRYADNLTSGRFTYDPESWTFDGPWRRW